MIQFENIHKKFNKNSLAETTLYDSLSLDVEDGEFITIIGSNGSGKSTLLNMLCGQVKPDAGAIGFKGNNLLKIKDFRRFKTISRVYQDPVAGTSPSLTVLENLSMAVNKGKLFNLGKAVRHDKDAFFKEQLATLDLGLEDKLHVQVGQLSGGQRQALSLLMALMNNPEVLLLDEHTAALDPKSSEAIMKLTDKMIKERNITSIMVTHNLQHALDYGDRLIMFHRGEIIYDVKGEAKDKLQRSDLIRLFLEHEDTFADTI
ncbi:ATP-binding cassette domain-containing protein [Erysipelothrix sp. HDW6C]|uniref:ABC transporter ATP-binding protein n=1 Tax=Erysipelothrix sp. HDW6C TaxID=2714930 RepID=UPI00140C5052|nr:ATP-binding cassette domain-containing protein [Erysipelothrix sp. HDW6C]QIK70541.1 ATP-binding cassette domain-containing protein [Erysipelothrix sp. HDW6C]